MATNKTTATDADVDAYIASRASGQQVADCRELMALFAAVTGQTPKMWGPSIVGYGSCRYTYESGRTGEAPLAGFAIRGREICVYLDCEGGPSDLLPRLGRHRAGKSCLYLRQLADVDAGVLEQLVRDSVSALRQRYG